MLITLDFFEPAGKLYRRSTEQFSEIAYTRAQMKDMLAQAGMYIEAVYDEEGFSEPGETAQREIYVVRKVKT